MLGATYLAVARRARMASKAFADNITASSAAGVTERKLVDDAFLAVVRGTNANTAVSYLRDGDDLLGDKYGYEDSNGKKLSVTGRIADVSTVSGSQALLRLTATGLSPAPTNAAELNGCVITLLMPNLTASTRVLQATGSGTSPSIIVAAGPTVSGVVLSNTAVGSAIGASSGINMVINGREFADTGTNEPYDGFDVENPLLTQIVPAENGLSDNNGDGDVTDVQVVNAAPLYGSTTLDVDNDADGISDSAFIDVGLAPVISSTGAIVYPRAAILVTDLDGRVNVNLHGSAVDGDLLDGGFEMYPNVGAVTQYHLPRGAAVGPASGSITRSLLLGSPANASNEQELTDNALTVFSGLPQDTTTKQTLDANSGREVPRIYGTQGRYGGVITAANAGDVTYLTNEPRPGFDRVNDNGAPTQSPDRWRAGLVYDAGLGTWVADDYFSNPGRYGSPFDFKGRLRVWADPATGQPVFYKPFWDETVSGASYDNELIDDPYEVNFSHGVSQQSTPNAGTIVADNLFSPGELEGLLRYFDSDSLKLNRRLVTLLGGVASSNRLSVTTESWDTPAVVGSAWNDVIGQFAAGISSATSAVRPPSYNRIQDVFAPETLMGLKLDLNRPFHDAPEDANGNGVLDPGEDLDGNGWLDAEPNDATGLERRQLLAQQLYCLMVAIAEANGATLTAKDAEQIAQYAVNIVDFRDADSVMTPFDYDVNFGGGSTTWSPTGRVWGCERPELIITETFAWHDRKTTYDVMSGSFAQSDRPEGSFYVELASLWNAQAFEYDSVNVTAVAKSIDESPPPSNMFVDTPFHGHLNGQDDSGSLRAEPLPHELIDPGTRGDLLSAAIDLEKINANNDPVWRLVSVDGGSAFGTDPVLSATHTGSNWALDPSRPGGPTPERYFYFTQPVTNTADLPCHGIPSATAIFWQTSAGGFDPGPGTYGVAGTPRPPPFGLNVANSASFRAFRGVNGQFGTLTEPLGLVDGAGKSTSNGSMTNDPYDQLVKTLLGAGYVSYTPGTDPLTSNPDPNYGSWGNSPNSAIDATNEPALLTNGTHANYAVVHLQRLANPDADWDATDNPYLTIDCMPVDLTVVNTNGANTYDDPAGNIRDDESIDVTTDRQRQFVANTIERGGTNAGSSFDIWNRSPVTRTSLTDLHDPNTFRAEDPTFPNNGSDNRRVIKDPSVGSYPTPVVSHQLGNAPTAGTRYPWLVFLNRPFVSAAELAMVPVASPFHLTQRHSPATSSSVSTPDFLHHLAGFFESPTPAAPWDTVTGRSGTSHPSLLDFVHVPSPYVGLRNTVRLSPTANSTALENQLGLDVRPLEQISTFREPGRVNVNTITDSRVWRSLFGSLKAREDPDVEDPSFTGNALACDYLPGFSTEVFGRTPLDANGQFQSYQASSPREIFEYLPSRQSTTRQANKVVGGFRDNFAQAHRDTDMHPYFRYQTRMQLENLVTVRSNVYAVWVTVGYFDAQSGGSEITPIKRNRGFYIFDRSIPVAYERGKDHNVRDAILLRRIIQ